MNNPPYYVVDAIGQVVEATRIARGMTSLNYQYGYVSELNETLIQYSKSPQFEVLKFPLVWLCQPFILSRGVQGFFGSVSELRIFIINQTPKNIKAKQRMEDNFKTVLYPIYLELFNQMNLNPAISYQVERPHVLIDRYFWGNQQQAMLNDVVDCLEVSQIEFKLNNNSNCP